MILQSIELTNFGLYKGTHTIHFAPERDKPVTLIGGLNGRGKTTLLDAITLGLYGRRALKYLQDERIRYSTYLKNHINKSVPFGSITSIRITLADSENGSEAVTVCRYWEKPFRGEIEEKLIATRNNLEDEYLSQNWDYYMEEILPLSISRFFFFDNEKISQIADDDSFESVKDSIRSLLGLTTIDQLVADMGKLSKKAANETTSEAENDLLLEANQLQAQIEDCEQKAGAAYSEAGALNRKLKIYKERFDDAQDRFWKAGGNLGLERNKLKEELKALESLLSQYNDRVINIVNESPIPLLCCKQLLEKLNEEEKTKERNRVRMLSSNVINELIEHLKTVQGYSDFFQNEARDFLLRAKESLYSNIDVQDENKLSNEALQLLTNFLASFSTKVSEINQLLNQISISREQSVRIESHLAREVNDMEAQKIWNSMMDLNQAMNECEVELRLIEEKRKHIEREQEILENRRQKLLNTSMGIKRNQGEASRVIRYAQVVIQTMEAYKERLTVMRVKALADSILNCFQSMMGKSSMINQIQIDSKTLDIKLIDYTGSELLKNQLSAGEKQLFAVSIIWGLAQCSGYEMPVVIDTPLGRLDSKHRQNYVEGYLPSAGKQVIVLSTDEEINGRYLDAIKPHVNAYYTLVYDEQDRSSTIQPGYFGGERA